MRLTKSGQVFLNKGTIHSRTVPKFFDIIKTCIAVSRFVLIHWSELKTCPCSPWTRTWTRSSLSTWITFLSSLFSTKNSTNSKLDSNSWRSTFSRLFSVTYSTVWVVSHLRFFPNHSRYRIDMHVLNYLTSCVAQVADCFLEHGTFV